MMPTICQACGGTLTPGHQCCPEAETTAADETTLEPCGDNGKARTVARFSQASKWPGFAIPGGHGYYGSGAGAFLDWYNDKLQIVVEDSTESDAGLNIRLNADGTIAEIVVRPDLLPLIHSDCDPSHTSVWQAERDRETRGEGDEDAANHAQCRGCAAPVARNDPYFATPCRRTYCEQCMEDHLLDCATCREECCTECGAPAANGEGYDGLCGNCADKKEKESK